MTTPDDLTDEQIGRYHDRHIKPLMRGMPSDVQAAMRRRYIADLRTNRPEARGRIREEAARVFTDPPYLQGDTTAQDES